MLTPMTAKSIRMSLLIIFGCSPEYAQTVLVVMRSVLEEVHITLTINNEARPSN